MVKITNGQVFGRLTVSELTRIQNRTCAVCRCECGNDTVVRVDSLVDGKTRSCGCLQKERASTVHLKHGHMALVRRRTLTYRSWNAMKQRCGNPNHKRWPRYGGRGINFDPLWADFSGFLADVGERPTRKHTLHRLDNDRNYEPGNVCWSVDHKEVA